MIAPDEIQAVDEESTVDGLGVGVPNDLIRAVHGYVVDAADRDGIPISRSELLDLLIKPSLNGIPLLILGNKIDKSEALSK
ncbi:hypothetical protein GIB67_032173 [Kingdonia uniflora]|uniref:Uncharacterized protein n=1 Tax=Kingdonia uniflora TaxID=39325 RepID=A0A7J7MX93_9MAGN|nr:hypothetical protein GIB67_032173 [Kingdonia uniflora]